MPQGQRVRGSQKGRQEPNRKVCSLSSWQQFGSYLLRKMAGRWNQSRDCAEAHAGGTERGGGHSEGDAGGRKKHFAKSITSSSWLAACGRKGGVSPGFLVGQQVAPGEDHVYIKIKERKPA